MAIARGAGTEIIRCHHFEEVDDATTNLIVGVQHHIYTVLSIVIMAHAKQAVGNQLYLYLKGYDSKGGTSAVDMRIFEEVMPVSGTYVWNDKFSFNGTEPADFASGVIDATKQDAIADQDPSNGSPVSQILWINSQNAADDYDVHITFIDQNNS